VIIISYDILIIIAVKNEEKYLDKCLESLFLQNFPEDRYKITIVDGLSSDNTLRIASEWQKKYPRRISICNNPLEWQASSRNIGIKSDSESNLVAYIDGHCIADKNWLKNLDSIFNQKQDADLAGVGSIIASPHDESDIGQTIDLVFSTVLGAAGSSYKAADAIQEVKTAPYVLYSRSALEKVNFYDEDIKIGEDFALNYKLRAAGLKLFVNPDAIVYYYKRSSIIQFFYQMVNYGIAKAIIAKKFSGSITVYHYLPSIVLVLVGVMGISGFFIAGIGQFLLFGFGIYLLVLFSYGIFFSIIRKKLKFLLLVPLVFLAEHFGYSAGFIAGLFRKGWKKNVIA
jgi:glycosyltransferase involved in cell wall biosynthesis